MCRFWISVVLRKWLNVYYIVSPLYVQHAYKIEFGMVSLRNEMYGHCTAFKLSIVLYSVL